MEQEKKFPPYKVFTLWWDEETGEILNLPECLKLNENYWISDGVLLRTGSEWKSGPYRGCWAEFLVSKRGDIEYI
jgi:hypothetical protein